MADTLGALEKELGGSGTGDFGVASVSHYYGSTRAGAYPLRKEWFGEVDRQREDATSEGRSSTSTAAAMADGGELVRVAAGEASAVL